MLSACRVACHGATGVVHIFREVCLWALLQMGYVYYIYGMTVQRCGSGLADWTCCMH